MRNLTMCAALIGGLVIAGVSTVPVSAAPFSNSAAVKSAVEPNVTDVQSRRGWSARNKSYFKRDCMGDYDSAGVKCYAAHPIDAAPAFFGTLMQRPHWCREHSLAFAHATRLKGLNQSGVRNDATWRKKMYKSNKTVVAAILAAGLMTGTAYAQQGVNEVGEIKAMKASDSTQVRTKKQARVQARAQTHDWQARGWNGHPFGWPGAAAAGAGYAAGTVIGGATNTAGAIVGAPFGAYAYDRSGFHANAPIPYGPYGAYPEYDSGGNAIFPGPNDMPCSLNLKQLNRC